MTNHAFTICCVPDEEDDSVPISEQLQRPYLGLFKTQWKSPPHEIEFHLPHGEWIKLLRDNGFIVERLLELGSSPESKTRYPWADAEWASKWPTEEVWCVRLSG